LNTPVRKDTWHTTANRFLGHIRNRRDPVVQLPSPALEFVRESVNGGRSHSQQPALRSPQSSINSNRRPLGVCRQGGLMHKLVQVFGLVAAIVVAGTLPSHAECTWRWQCLAGPSQCRLARSCNSSPDVAPLPKPQATPIPMASMAPIQQPNPPGAPRTCENRYLCQQRRS
jgi:hypothetical protein